MSRKLLFYDIDGTILTNDGTRRISESTRQSIARARANGHLAFVNTGRVYSNIEPMIRDVGFDGYVCGCGTDIYYQENSVYHWQVDVQLCRKTAEVVRACGLQPLYEARDFSAIDSRIDPMPAFRELVAYFQENNRDIKDIQDTDFYFDKFTAWYSKEADILSFCNWIEPYFDFIDRGMENGSLLCEVVPKGLSKATGIQKLQAYLNIALEDCYAFGDSANDLPMLTYVPHSVAMGGSGQEVCNVVEFVTKSIDEDGIAYAMQHYGLLNN